MILVTGGTGLVGSHLLLHLAQKGYKLRATHRKLSRLADVKKVFSYYVADGETLFKQIEWVEANLNDLPALEVAFEGVTKVYHAAAMISFDPNDYSALLKINVEGTANVVNLCLAYKVDKLCYVSSIAAIGKSIDDSFITEETEFTEEHADVYARSKNAAELEVWRASQEGLAVVIVNPGIIIGPGFWEGGSGTLFTTASKEFSYHPPGGTGCVAVLDVVKAMIGLMDSSIEKERFILVSENKSFKEIMTSFTQELDVSPPTKELQIWQLQLLRFLDALWYMLTRKARRITKNGIESVRRRNYFNNEKIQQMLGFTFEPIAKSIAFSCERFKEENLS